jgi:hypothetical protein
VVDALSSRFVIFSTINAKLLGFEYMKELYANDSNFTEVYVTCKKSVFGKFYKLDSYLFKENKLCVPDCFMYELLVHEAYKGGLMRYFDIRKTLKVLYRHFYWPKMKRDVQNMCDRCITCRQVKSKVLSHGLYTLFVCT